MGRRGFLLETKPASEYADIFWHGEWCDWQGCTRSALWDIVPHVYGPGVRPGCYCTRHARIIVRAIDKAGENAEAEAPTRVLGGESTP